jgi:hypothetical protein
MSVSEQNSTTIGRMNECFPSVVPLGLAFHADLPNPSLSKTSHGDLRPSCTFAEKKFNKHIKGGTCLSDLTTATSHRTIVNRAQAHILDDSSETDPHLLVQGKHCGALVIPNWN